MKSGSTHQFWIAGLLVVSLLAGGLIFYTTRWGPGVYSDAAVYFSAAENIASGHGYGVYTPTGRFSAITNQAPVYPLILSSMYLLHLDPITGARWLLISLFVLTVFAVGWFLGRLSSQPWNYIPVVLLMIACPSVIIVYSSVGTDAPFVFFVLSGVLLLMVYIRTNRKIALFSSLVFSGLATVTRYSGVFLPPLGALMILIFQDRAWIQRLRNSFFFGAATLLPFVFWILWASVQPGSQPSFRSPFANSPWDYLRTFRESLLKTLWSWIPFGANPDRVPYNEKKFVLIILLVVWVSILLLSLWKLYRWRLSAWLIDADAQVAIVFGLGSLLFVIFFILAYLIDRIQPDANLRTLLMLYLLLIISMLATVTIAARAWLPILPKSGFIFPLVLAGFLISSFLPQTQVLAVRFHQQGDGYTSPGWRSSATIQAVRGLPQQLLVISNETGAVFFLTGRPALEINEAYSPKTPDQFIRYGEDQQDGSEKLFRQRRAALVIFQWTFIEQMGRLYEGSAQQRIDSMFAGLEIFGKYQDGTIYMYPEE